MVLWCCGVVVEIWLKAGAGAGAGGGHNPVPVLCSGQQQALVLSRHHGLEWCTPAHLVSRYSLDSGLIVWHLLLYEQEWRGF